MWISQELTLYFSPLLMLSTVSSFAPSTLPANSLPFLELTGPEITPTSAATSSPLPLDSPMLGLHSKASLLAFLSSPATQTHVYQNVEFPGADYRSFFTADHEECQRACTQDPACRFFTFANGLFTPEKYRFKCQLKYSWAIPRTPDVETKAGVTSGFSHKTKFTQHFDTACEGRLFVNTAIPEHHLQKLSAASPQQCQTLCSAHPLCTYFTYVSTNLTCLLKNNRNEMVIKNKEGVTSGMPARFCQPDNNWIKVAHKDVDFPGSNIRFEPKDNADACQKACTNDKYCQFYSYVNDNFSDPALRRRCYLKRVITMPAPPKVAKLANVVSGFTKKNCHGQKQ